MYSPTSKIKFDELYRNRTLMFLVPMLKTYGKQFSVEFSNLTWQGFFIGDYLYSENIEKYIFCVANYKNIADVLNLQDYLKNKDYYVDDYIFSLEKKLHVFVLLNPVKKMDKFLQGKYSTLYYPEEVDKYFLKKIKREGREYYTKVYSILKKLKSYEHVFINDLKEEFGTQTLPEGEFEYDFPPLLNQEILNYDA